MLPNSGPQSLSHRTGTGATPARSLHRPVSRASRRDQPRRNAGLMNQCSLLWTGEQVSWWTRAAPSVPFRGDAGEVDAGGVAVVDVPGEHADRRRRPLTGIPGRGPSDQPGEPVEGVVEGLPVLEVGALADRLSEPAAPAGPVGRDLVDRLHVAERVGEQPGQRGAQDEVVDGAVGHLLLDPAELAVAEHEVSAVVEDPPVPRVDHDEPARAEVPAEAEPHAFRPVDLGVGPVGELDEQRPGVPVGVEDLAVVGVGGQFARAGGCPGAGRPSRTPAPRGSARATTASGPSAGAMPARCSSRRGRRGRRRSSRWGRRTSASGPRGRPRSRGRARRIRRSRRSRHRASPGGGPGGRRCAGGSAG